MPEPITSASAELLSLAISVGVLIGAYNFGAWVTGKTKRLWAGWLAGIGLVVLIGVVIAPIKGAIDEAKCRSDSNPELCESGYGGQDY